MQHRAKLEDQAKQCKASTIIITIFVKQSKPESKAQQSKQRSYSSTTIQMLRDAQQCRAIQSNSKQGVKPETITCFKFISEVKCLSQGYPWGSKMMLL